MAVFLPGSSDAPTAAAAITALGDHDVDAVEIAAIDDARWTIEGAWGRLSCFDADIPAEIFEWVTGDLSDAEREAAQTARAAIEIETVLDDPLLESYRDQLRVLHRVAPTAVAVHDRSAHRWHPRSWWIDAIETRTPPSPQNLFTIHAVTDDSGAVWLHTHGLTRGGSIELEILDVTREHSNGLSSLLQHTAIQMLENGTPEPGEPVAVGHGIEICWKPWQDIAARFAKDAVGGRGDRDDDDHTGARGVLCLPGDEWRSVAGLVPILDDNPVFWISSMETRRMEMLAVERFPAFRELVQRFVDDEDWSFVAKLGYRIDAADDGDGDPDDLPSEHMWFHVHAVDGARIDATLLNEPYRIERMKAGDRGWHAVDQLSDWSVDSPWGAAGPDQIGIVFDRLAAAEGDLR